MSRSAPFLALTVAACTFAAPAYALKRSGEKPPDSYVKKVCVKWEYKTSWKTRKPKDQDLRELAANERLQLIRMASEIG